MTMTRLAEQGRARRWLRYVSIGLAIPLFCPLFAQAAPPLGAVLASAAVGQGSYGTIKGRLVWGGDTAPPAEDLVAKGEAKKDPEICAKDQRILSHALEVDPKTKGVAYGFAYIVRPKGTNPDAVKDLLAKKPKVEVDQKNCDFLPHSTAILQDQALLLKSSDAVGHNVRLTGLNNPGINQVLAPKGELEVKLIAERFPVNLACDIHPWMHGHVMVFDHPFFAVTGPDGSFEIKGVPAGSQNLVVWQEKVGFVTPGRGQGTPVKVAAGEVTNVGDQTRSRQGQIGRGGKRAGRLVARSTPDVRRGSAARHRSRFPPRRRDQPMGRYRIGRSLQFLGLMILPFAIASELVGEVGLGQSMLIAAVGAAVFYVGYVVQNRP